MLERDESHRVEANLREPGDLDRQSALADPAGPHEGYEPAAVDRLIAHEPREQGFDIGVPADDVGARHRETTGRRLGEAGGARRSRSVESLGEERREVGLEQPRELIRVREGLV